MVSQYPDGAPMLIAIGGWISDATLLRVAPVIGGVALLGFYALARAVVREWWALGATALLAISMPMINFSRSVYSEPTTMVFLLGGLALLFACDARGGVPLHLVTGITSGRPRSPGSTAVSTWSRSPATVGDAAGQGGAGGPADGDRRRSAPWSAARSRSSASAW